MPETDDKFIERLKSMTNMEINWNRESERRALALIEQLQTDLKTHRAEVTNDACADTEMLARLRELADACKTLRLSRQDDAIRWAVARIAELEGALSELVEVADLRGDSMLPHPADDPILWTARMQTAWDEARTALAPAPAKEEEVRT